MPQQHVQFSLIRPILRPVHETVLDWILPEVEPFLLITFTAAQLPVEEVPLPNGLFLWPRPMPAGLRAPEPDPPLHRRGRPLRGRAEQVQMIPQDDPAPDEPENGRS